MTLLWTLSIALAGETTHEVEVAGGADYLTRTDQLFSPLPHAGVSPTATLGWSPRGPRDTHLVRLSFTPATIRPPGEAWRFTRDGETVETSASSATVVDLQYAWGHRIDADRLTVHVGATSANHLENMVSSFAFNGVETYFGAFELGPWADARLRVGERHALEAEAWVPVAAWIGRNPYSVHDAEHIYNTRDPSPVVTAARYIADGSLQTVNTYQAVHLRGAYSFALSERFTVFARGRADGLHYALPRSMAEWQLGLDLGLRGTF